MSKLDDFLNLNDVSEIKQEIEIEFNGKKFNLTIKPLTDREHSEFQKRSYSMSKNKVTMDTAKYNNLVLDACIIEPNFKDESFLKKVNCLSSIEFLTKKFPAGVLMDIAQRIQKLSGFESYEMEIENAKN